MLLSRRWARKSVLFLVWKVFIIWPIWVNAIIKNSAMWLVSPTFCLKWPDILFPPVHTVNLWPTWLGQQLFWAVRPLTTPISASLHALLPFDPIIHKRMPCDSISSQYTWLWCVVCTCDCGAYWSDLPMTCPGLRKLKARSWEWCGKHGLP